MTWWYKDKCLFNFGMYSASIMYLTFTFESSEKNRSLPIAQAFICKRAISNSSATKPFFSKKEKRESYTAKAF